MHNNATIEIDETQLIIYLALESVTAEKKYDSSFEQITSTLV